MPASLDLPDVTLVIIDTVAPALARMAVDDCMAAANFAAVICYTDNDEWVPDNCAVYRVEAKSHDDVARILWHAVPRRVNTKHFLFIGYDAWIRDPGAWKAEFADYDYIGAPWPPDIAPPHLSVGNGGFSLRSTQLMRYVADTIPIQGPEDVAICRTHRPALEAAGFRFAPPSLARSFSLELQRVKDRTFGFHGTFNWPLVLSEEGLARRMRHADGYLTRTGQVAMIAGNVEWLRQERRRDQALAGRLNLDSVVQPPLLHTMQKGIDRYRYRGVPMQKCPFDLALYSMLIWETKPRTIIEIGSHKGGSALWFADQLRAFGIDGHVYSVDAAPPDWWPKVRDETITFLCGNALELDLLGFDAAEIKRPLLVVEDSAHIPETTAAVLQFFHPHMIEGEYIVIEDGNAPLVDPMGGWRGGPLPAIADFLAIHPDDYEIDTALCDWFGANATANPNGYLRRIR